MNLAKMLSELRAEAARLDEIISLIESLALGHGKRRGRPPKWVTAAARTESTEGEKPKRK